MAAPYPPNPYGPGAGMQPRPMMPTGAQRAQKRGVSKAVPVVVSAGLAVGVFCGLLFGLGTGKAPATAGPSKGNNLKPAADKEAAPLPGAAPAGVGATAAAPPPRPDAGTVAVVAATGSAGSATAKVAAGPVAAAVVATKLTIEVEPAAAAAIAKITVDGKDITGTSIDVTADKKAVKVSVSATGYHSIDNKKVDIVAGTDMKVQLELTKRAAGGSPGFGGASSTPNHVPTAPPRPKKPPNSGIIDI
jgi:hypothetical protein